MGAGLGLEMGVSSRVPPPSRASLCLPRRQLELARRRRLQLQVLGSGDCGCSTGLGRWQRRQWRRGLEPRRGPSRRRVPRGRRRRWSCGSVSSIAPHVIPLPAALVVLLGVEGASRSVQGIPGTAAYRTAQRPSGST